MKTIFWYRVDASDFQTGEVKTFEGDIPGNNVLHALKAIDNMAANSWKHQLVKIALHQMDWSTGTIDPRPIMQWRRTTKDRGVVSQYNCAKVRRFTGTAGEIQDIINWMPRKDSQTVIPKEKPRRRFCHETNQFEDVPFDDGLGGWGEFQGRMQREHSDQSHTTGKDVFFPQDIGEYVPPPTKETFKTVVPTGKRKKIHVD